MVAVRQHIGPTGNAGGGPLGRLRQHRVSCRDRMRAVGRRCRRRCARPVPSRWRRPGGSPGGRAWPARRPAVRWAGGWARPGRALPIVGPGVDHVYAGRAPHPYGAAHVVAEDEEGARRPEGCRRGRPCRSSPRPCRVHGSRSGSRLPPGSARLGGGPGHGHPGVAGQVGGPGHQPGDRSAGGVEAGLDGLAGGHGPVARSEGRELRLPAGHTVALLGRRPSAALSPVPGGKARCQARPHGLAPGNAARYRSSTSSGTQKVWSAGRPRMLLGQPDLLGGEGSPWALAVSIRWGDGSADVAAQDDQRGPVLVGLGPADGRLEGIEVVGHLTDVVDAHP